MTTDDRDLEAAMAGLLTTAPATLAPGVLAEVGLADRYARIDSPIGPLVVAWNGLGVVARRGRRPTTPRSRRRTWRGPGGRAIRAPTGCRPRSRGRSRRRLGGDRRVRIDLDLRGHTDVRARRLAQGPGDPARRGAAVRLDRRRDRPPEGGPRGRDRARAQPGAADRALPPRRPDGRDRSASTRWAGRTTSGRSSPPRGSTPTRWSRRRGPASAIVGSDTTQVVCLPTCHARQADHAGRIGCRSARSRTAVSAGYPAVAVPSGVGIAGRLSVLRLHRLARHATLPTLDHPSMPTTRQPRRRRGRGSGSACSSSTSCGARPTSAIAIAVDTIPPFLMAAARFLLAGLVLLGWSFARERTPFACPTRREWRDSAIVGALLLGGGMGMVALRRADGPVGHRRAADRADAGLGRGPRRHLPRRATAPAGRRSGSWSGSSAWPSCRAIRVGGAGRARTARAGRDPALPDRLVERVAVRVAPGHPAQPAARRDRAPDGPRRAVLARDGVVSGELRAPVRRAAVTVESSVGALLYLTVIGSLLAFTDLRLAAASRAAAAHRDLCLREPGRRGHPRRHRPARADRARTLVAGAVIIVAVALIVTARGRMQLPRATDVDPAQRPVGPAPISVARSSADATPN